MTQPCTAAIATSLCRSLVALHLRAQKQHAVVDEAGTGSEIREGWASGFNFAIILSSPTITDINWNGPIGYWL